MMALWTKCPHLESDGSKLKTGRTWDDVLDHVYLEYFKEKTKGSKDSQPPAEKESGSSYTKENAKTWNKAWLA